MLPPAKGIGLQPEIPGLHAQRRDEGIVLHVLRAQRLIKIVQQGNDGFRHIRYSFSGKKRL